MISDRPESVQRVAEAARQLGLDIALRDMPASTRTAADAATACGCAVDQIVKSLIFQRKEDGSLVLLLVSGAHRVDDDRARAAVGASLEKADPARVQAETGFAVGGVAPIGHLHTLPVWMDETLFSHATVWAAGGGPRTVFSIDPGDLARATGARRVPLA